jgi:hypothetical protein
LALKGSDRDLRAGCGGAAAIGAVLLAIIGTRSRQLWLAMASGLALVALAALISPELLIALGPMRNSLESANDLVRRTAHFEVLILQLTSLVAGVGLLVAAVVWPRLRRHALARSALAKLRATHVPPPGASSVGSASFLLVSGAVAAGIACLAVGPQGMGTVLYMQISEEDGLVEQTTAIVFLLASGLAFVAARHVEHRARRIVLRTLFVGFLLCFAEEISWGQRILGIDTPALIARVNVQGEINLHNLVGYAADHLFIAAIFVYGALLPLLAAVYPSLRRLCAYLGLPMASPGLAAAFLVASLVHEWTIFRVLPKSHFRPAEIRELASSMGLALLMWETLRLEVRARPRVPGVSRLAGERVSSRLMSR